MTSVSSTVAIPRLNLIETARVRADLLGYVTAQELACAVVDRRNGTAESSRRPISWVIDEIAAKAITSVIVEESWTAEQQAAELYDIPQPRDLSATPQTKVSNAR